jgi:hypothetical protein
LPPQQFYLPVVIKIITPGLAKEVIADVQAQDEWYKSF